MSARPGTGRNRGKGHADEVRGNFQQRIERVFDHQIRTAVKSAIGLAPESVRRISIEDYYAQKICQQVERIASKPTGFTYNDTLDEACIDRFKSVALRVTEEEMSGNG